MIHHPKRAWHFKTLTRHLNTPTRHLNTPTHPHSACTTCGAVLESGAFAQDVQFIKGATGDAAVVGQYVTGDGTRTQRAGSGRLFGAQDSHERTAQKGREEIEFLANYVQLPQPRESLIEQAFRLYKLALQHSFTKGRRVDQVAAACLYTICRIDGKPFMLIDFSDALQVNVFTLGNVFMQLMQLLRMQEHPLINKYGGRGWVGACGVYGRGVLEGCMRE